MSLSIKVPFNNHNHLNEKAKAFLKKYHPKNTLPIPIEDIIDLHFGIDVIPIPGLHKNFEIDGFLSSDLQSISVDMGVYESRQRRLRFTLAHEMGHLLLHEEIYKNHKFKMTKDWKKFIKDFPEDEYSWFEWQANEFAGLVLVPCSHLERRLSYNVKQVRGLGVQDENVIYDRVVELLSEDFTVSRDVIQRRLNKEAKKRGVDVLSLMS